MDSESATRAGIGPRNDTSSTNSHVAHLPANGSRVYSTSAGALLSAAISNAISAAGDRTASYIAWRLAIGRLADLQGELGTDVFGHAAGRINKCGDGGDTRGPAVDGDVSNGLQDDARRAAPDRRPV